MMFICKKDRVEFNSIESYVFDCLEKNSIDWFPQKSESLQEDDESAESLVNGLSKGVEEVKNKILEFKKNKIIG